MIGLSRGYLVPILTAPLKVCKAMKNSSEHDTMSEHRETDHRMRPQFPQVEMHQPTSKTPCSPRFHWSSGPKAFDYSHLICAQWSGFQIPISGIIFGTETNLDLSRQLSSWRSALCFLSAIIQEKQVSLETVATYGGSVGIWARNRITAAEPLATFGCCVLATGWEELAN